MLLQVKYNLNNKWKRCDCSLSGSEGVSMYGKCLRGYTTLKGLGTIVIDHALGHAYCNLAYFLGCTLHSDRYYLWWII